MITIKTWRDPYEAGFSPTKPKEININEGLTVLVGCNGAGKTTLLLNIEEFAKDNKIPCHMYNNLHDGGSSNVLSAALSGYQEFDCDDMSLGVSMWTASEGEAIKMNIGRQSTLYKEFLNSGYYKDHQYNLSTIFREDIKEPVNDNRRILLFDATDSGLSIDAVCEIKRLFSLILEDAKKLNIKLYLIIAANEYELCRHEQCFDVNEGCYLTFADYEDYRKFIINNRKKKEKRIDKQIIWQEKKRAKEQAGYEKLKNEINLKKEKILKGQKKEELSWSERYKIDDLNRKLDDYLRHECRYFHVDNHTTH